ncbi:MAG: SapC family protein [Gammaproteobacteria bacterium]
MPQPALLNNVQHKDLRVKTGYGEQFGDRVMYAFTFPAEFRSLQAYYPIVFHQTEAEPGFEALALLGFQDGENLFLNDTGWDVPIVPLTIARQPFMIGRDGDQLLVHIDLDHPRVNTSEGEAVFLPHGGNTDYLNNVSQTLFDIHQGVESMAGFINTLKQYDLLEPFVADITLDDGSQNRLVGFFTIHEERLAGLDAAAIDRLHKLGYLQAIYMQLASLSNFRALIDRKNKVNLRAIQGQG